MRAPAASSAGGSPSRAPGTTKPPARCLVAYRRLDDATDGIAGHTKGLVAALSLLSGLSVAAASRPRATSGCTVVLQYSPFSWGRWGFAPQLVLEAVRLRGSRLVLLVHEPYLPFSTPRSWPLAIWQRIQLRVLVALADEVVGTVEGWSSRLSRAAAPRMRHLPVGSNLPDTRDSRPETRAAFELGDDDVVIAAFSTPHPGWSKDHVTAALRRLATAPGEFVVLNLGASSVPLDGAGGLRVITPGRQPPEELAAFLAAADVLLCPFVDGVSTRRTTMMAGLQHEVAVIGTRGELTGPLLEGKAGDAVVLTPAGDPAAFAEAVVALCTEQPVRRRTARRGRALFEEEFDWPVLAAALASWMGPQGA